MNPTIQKLSNQHLDEFVALVRLFEQVFEWEQNAVPGRAHLQKVLENPSFLVFVAKVEQQLVGGLTVHVLPRYDSEKPSAYIYDLAVSPDWQRMGIGQKLIATLNDYCEQNGFDEVFVQAETDDTHAVNFYRKTPITDELQASHFTYTLPQKH